MSANRGDDQRQNQAFGDTPSTPTDIVVTPYLEVFGDVHNHLNALETALYHGMSATAHKVFLGDLVHKGPAENCEKLVRHIQRMVNAGEATVVRGNHDHTAKKGPMGGPDHTGTLDYVQAEWLMGLPLFVRYSGWLFLHGGISASVAEAIEHLIEEGQLPREGDWTPSMVIAAEKSLSNKWKRKLHQIMFTRYITPTGKMVSYGKETPEDTFWASSYDGRYGYALFGHNPFNAIRYFENAMGCDLGIGSGKPYLGDEKVGAWYRGPVSSEGRLARVSIDTEEQVIYRVAAYRPDGLPSYSMSESIPQVTPPQYRGKKKLVRAYYGLIEDGLDPFNEIYLMSILKDLGEELEVPRMSSEQLERLREDIEECSLNVEHSTGEDEAPTPGIKMALLLQAEESLIVGLEQGLETEVNRAIDHWHWIVDFAASDIRSAELSAKIKTHLSIRERSGKLLQFWEGLCL